MEEKHIKINNCDGREEVLINKAAELAEPFNAKIWLLNIASPEPDFVGYRVGAKYIRDTLDRDLRKEHKCRPKLLKNQRFRY